MKKVSTAARKQSRNFSQQKLTIGLDLGDRSSCYCVLDETGSIVLEQRVATTPKALPAAFGAMPRSRIALETGTASRAAAVVGGTGVAERADSRVQRTDRKLSPGELSAGGAAEADQGRGHTDRTDVLANAGRSASLSQESRRGLLFGIAARAKKLRADRAADAQ